MEQSEEHPLVNNKKERETSIIFSQLVYTSLCILFSWSLMRLAMVQLVLQNLKTFYPMAGHDLSGKSVLVGFWICLYRIPSYCLINPFYWCLFLLFHKIYTTVDNEKNNVYICVHPCLQLLFFKKIGFIHNKQYKININTISQCGISPVP